MLVAPSWKQFWVWLPNHPLSEKQEEEYQEELRKREKLRKTKHEAELRMMKDEEINKQP